MLKNFLIILLLSGGYANAIQPVYKNTTGKHKIDCNNLENVAVLLVLGQSNAANSGEVKYAVKNQVINVYEGECYLANDPLLGATGARGSVWGRVADKLIDNGIFNNVVIKSIAVGGSPIVSWTQDGKGPVHGNYFKRIMDSIRELRVLGFEVTFILWHQGEQDTSFGTSTSKYKEMFLNMLNGIRKIGELNAPIYVARASLCQGRSSKKVIQAQNELIDQNIDILEGPNTDLINESKYRIDGGCHFSESGLKFHANMWYESISRGRHEGAN